jgi:dTDP-4-amino-4,6-dideoxygalactose transaminase
MGIKKITMGTNDKFLVFGSPLIEKEEIQEVVDTLNSGWIGTGPRVAKFEEMFRKYKKVEYAIAVNSCTAAIHLSLEVIGIKEGDEVLLPTMTFASTASAIIHAGGRPVFIDCNRDTMNIDPSKIEAKITEKTRAIIVVHFAGRPCEMDSILDLTRKYQLALIEDCAHALEAEYRGKKAGTFGDLGCFSFYVTKNIITGEGGMAITNNTDYADRIKIMALHGMSKDAWKRFSDSGYKHYHVIYPGFKYNMMDLQAALGIHQLPRVDKYWHKRQSIWNTYQEAFRGLPIVLPTPVPEFMKHSYHLFTLKLDIDQIKITRDQFLQAMTDRKIGVGVHYVALHMHPYYRKTYGYKRGDFPNAEWISDRTVSLPLSPKLTKHDVDRVISAVTGVLEGARLME